MHACPFCLIIHKQKSAAILYEDKHVIIILDHRPLFYGHALLIPKQHYETLADLPDSLTSLFFIKLQQIDRVVKKAMQAQGTFVAINNTVSQSVPHLHVHIVPRTKKDGLKGFFWPRCLYQGNDMEIVCQRLRYMWQQLY